MKTVAFAVGILLLTVSTSQAQGGAGKSIQVGGSNYQNYYYNPIRVLNSEYLTKDLKLTKEQLKRIKQIGLQMEGIRALRRPEIAKEIGISANQTKEINGVYDDYNKRRSAVYKLFRDRTKRDEARKKYAEISKEAKTLDGKVLDVLTNSQKRKFEKLKGEPFDRMKLYPQYKRRTIKKKPSI
jgi:hypothetical protein